MVSHTHITLTSAIYWIVTPVTTLSTMLIGVTITSWMSGGMDIFSTPAAGSLSCEKGRMQ